MEEFSGLLLGVCFAAVLGGMVLLLSPGGSTERTMRLLVTLFVLASLSVPLGNVLHSNLSVQTVVPQNAADTATHAVLENARKAMEFQTKKVLQKYDCPDAEIEIEMCISDSVVHTKKFLVTGVRPEKVQEVTDEIFTLTGERAVVKAYSGKASGG